MSCIPDPFACVLSSVQVLSFMKKPENLIDIPAEPFSSMHYCYVPSPLYFSEMTVKGTSFPEKVQKNHIETDKERL